MPHLYSVDITNDFTSLLYPGGSNSPQKFGVRENSLHFPRSHALEGGIGGGEHGEGPGLREEGDQAGQLEGGDEGGEQGVEDQEVEERAAGGAVMGDSVGQDRGTHWPGQPGEVREVQGVRGVPASDCLPFLS